MKQRILVIDDEEEIRGILRRQLEGAGYAVDVAADGHIAISMLQREHYDLAMVDILMPEKDGLEVIMYLQREQPMVRCIAISAPSNRVFLQSAELLGATRIIEKPFELKEVEAVVKSLLEDKPAA